MNEFMKEMMNEVTKAKIDEADFTKTNSEMMLKKLELLLNKASNDSERAATIGMIKHFTEIAANARQGGLMLEMFIGMNDKLKD